jgi:lactoylglutathione lyase
LHFGLRVTDRERSLAFYAAVGHEVVGEAPETGLGHLTMLKLPGDDYVSIELVHEPEGQVEISTGLSHFVIKVESMDDTLEALAVGGIDVEAPTSPDGSADFQTTWIVDPDGNRIELVQWPAGHGGGITVPTGPDALQCVSSGTSSSGVHGSIAPDRYGWPWIGRRCGPQRQPRQVVLWSAVTRQR